VRKGHPRLRAGSLNLATPRALESRGQRLEQGVALAQQRHLRTAIHSALNKPHESHAMAAARQSRHSNVAIGQDPLQQGLCCGQAAAEWPKAAQAHLLMAAQTDLYMVTPACLDMVLLSRHCDTDNKVKHAHLDMVCLRGLE